MSIKMNPTTTKRVAMKAMAVSVLAWTALSASPTMAQQAAPIKLLVGFPAGGGTDAIARTLADRLKDELKTPVVVENKAGAGGQLAAQTLKAAAPDGTTYFLSHDHSISILPLTVKNAGFDPAADFVSVAGFATFANAVGLTATANASSKDLPSYMAAVKKDAAGKGNVGIPAPASVPEFLVKALATRYQMDLTAVPYRGSAPLMVDMLGGHVTSGVASVPDMIEQHKAGKINIVAVMGDNRQASLPNVPTLSELGVKGFELLPYYGIFAPAATPKVELEKFQSALQKVLAQPDVKAKLAAMGLSVDYVPQAAFAKKVDSYTAAWRKIIQSSGYVAQ